MKRSCFTAKELFGMAYLMKKQKMYGIPDAMGAERNMTLQDVLDDLLSQNIAEMDIDGRITLKSEYFPTVNIFCDCQKCLTVNVHTENMSEHSVIFWQQDAVFYMAEVIDDRYVLAQTDEEMVKAMVSGLLFGGDTRIAAYVDVIPQMSIVKAKRVCEKGDYSQAINLIRQCGVSSDVCNVIVSGLCGNAYYLGLVYMDMRTGVCQKRESSFLGSNKTLLSLGQTTANLRTCATFTSVKREEMHNDVKSLVNSFLDKGERQ